MMPVDLRERDLACQGDRPGAHCAGDDARARAHRGPWSSYRRLTTVMRNRLVLMMWTAGGRPTLSPCHTPAAGSWGC